MVKSEKGSSLLIVLLTMTVFSIVGLSLLGLTVNSAKQTSITGSDLQATNAAEMGVTHLKEEVYQILSTTKTTTPLDIKTGLEGKLAANLAPFFDEDHPISLDEGLHYTFKDLSVTTTPETTGIIEKVFINYKVTGSSNNNKSIITGKIEATISEGTFPSPQSVPNVEVISEKIDYTNNIANDIPNPDLNPENPANIEKSYYFEEGFSYKGSSVLDFPKGIYSKGIISTSDSANNDITILGDAHIVGVDLKFTDKNGLLCVQGTLFAYGSGINPLPQVIDNLNCNIEQAKNGPDRLSGVITSKYMPPDKIPGSWNRENILIDADYE